MEFVRLDYAQYGFLNKRRAQKFVQNYLTNRKITEFKLSNTFGFKLKLDIPSDLMLYFKIEDSPYIVLNDGQVYTSKAEIMWNNSIKKVSVNI